jgi:KEOPS complex subunit Pcc1
LHALTIALEFGDRARAVYESLKPELHASPSERSTIDLRLDDGVLTMLIKAEDIVSMRAAINTWLRLVKIAEEMLNVRGMT